MPFPSWANYWQVLCHAVATAAKGGRNKSEVRENSQRSHHYSKWRVLLSSSITGFSKEARSRLSHSVTDKDSDSIHQKSYLVSSDPSETRAAASSACWLRDVTVSTQKLGLLSQSNSAHAKERKTNETSSVWFLKQETQLTSWHRHSQPMSARHSE